MISKIQKINIKFYILFGIVIAVAILTPHIVHGHVLVPERYVQSAILFLDLILGYIFYLVYRRDVAKAKEEKKKIEKYLLSSYKYIGQANVKIDLFGKFINSLQVSDSGESLGNNRDVFNDFLKTIVVSVAKAEKGLIRFIDRDSKKTINELYYHKEGDQFTPKLSNREVIENKNSIISNGDLNIIQSDYRNTKIRCVFCYFKEGNEEVDTVLLKTLLNQTHLLFLAVNSEKY